MRTTTDANGTTKTWMTMEECKLREPCQKYIDQMKSGAPKKELYKYGMTKEDYDKYMANLYK